MEDPLNRSVRSDPETMAASPALAATCAEPITTSLAPSRLSPDGRYLARERVDLLANTPDIWVEDLARSPNVRVTSAVEPNMSPAWSPYGRYLAYVHGDLPYRTGTRAVSIAAADGTGVIREIPCPADYCEPTDWTAHGLLVSVLSRERAAAYG